MDVAHLYLIIVNILMGNCVGASRSDPSRYCESTRVKSLKKECHLLKLIYADLGSRNVSNQLDHENFLLFFQKNGYWGNRLFREFDVGASNRINESEFIRGIAKIFKTSEDHKIELLFKFFSGCASKKQGVRFSQFLTMLYNYPKEDLKKILNDEQFFNCELRKNLVADNNIYKGRRLDSICFNNLSEKTFSDTTFRVQQCEGLSERLESRMESELLRDICKKNSTKSIAFKIKVGQSDVEVVTTNIHNLVKKFAISIFRSYNINIRNGQFHYEQFRDWMIKHKQLYNNYFKGFHSEIWEVNRKTMTPMFLEKKIDFQSEARIYLGSDRVKKIIIYLLQSILIVCEQTDLETPICIVCLDGLSTKRIFEEDKGNGIQITHRDEIYATKKFYLKDGQLADKWMQNLKFYQGCSIANLYSIGQKIGIGKFSVVYNCHENLTNQKYAIKVIESCKLQEQAKKLIAHESSIMSVVSHPMLVTFRQSIQTKTHIYIVTELVEGKDMFQYVRDSKFLSEEQAAYIVKQIIIGVRYLHSLGIVHRDLKPQNIMIEQGAEKGEIYKIKIIDFGFANYLESLIGLPPQQALAGTPNYIAPESLRLEPGMTEKVDNFAIGSILYFALSGNLPFSGCNMHEILTKTLEGSYQINDKRWRSVSCQAKDLINRLLQNDPLERISLDDALTHPWIKKYANFSEASTDSLSQGSKGVAVKN